jgi:HSP20 family protein
MNSQERSTQSQAQQQPSSSSGGSTSPSSSQQQPGAGGSSGGRGALAQRASSPYGMPSLFGRGPFELLRRLDEDMDRLFDEFWGGNRHYLRGGVAGASRAPSLWVPQVEMCEQGGKFHVYADLPGLKKDDVKISVEGDSIVLQGERRSSSESGERGRDYYHSERSYGSFYRAIPLPEGVDAGTAEASFKDGVLDVCFDAPKQSRASRYLEIKDESTPSGSSSAAGGATH